VTITLPLPPPLNQMYRTVPGGRGMYKSRKCKQWELEAQWTAKAADSTLIEGSVGIMVDLYLKNDRDIDSSTKALLDCLQGIAYSNDSQIKELLVRKFKDTANPRLEVIVNPA
jgi:Holliday junction resolvase RusA-like endonuclease